MRRDATMAGQAARISRHEGAARNERFVEKCLKQLNAASDAEEGLRQLLRFLGEELECERVYVFEEMDRQHIRNTYEWCRNGVPSGIEQLPYVAKKDLLPWYRRLASGENIIVPDVESLLAGDTLFHEILKPQQIRSVILSPLLADGKMAGFLGADNPPPENMEHISVLLGVLAYFVSSLVSRRELAKLREARAAARPVKAAFQPLNAGKTVLLVDDSPELLKCNERVLRPQGYRVLSAGTLRKAEELIAETRPDAVVLDIDLPDGSGLEFCQKLRGSIPVVFLTAHADKETVQSGRNAGGCAFLTKPYQLEDLRTAVAGAVRRKAEWDARAKPSFSAGCLER